MMWRGCSILDCLLTKTQIIASVYHEGAILDMALLYGILTSGDRTAQIAPKSIQTDFMKMNILDLCVFMFAGHLHRPPETSFSPSGSDAFVSINATVPAQLVCVR
jgi:hypothetical protein